MAVFYLNISVQTSDMLPHASTLASLTNNIPAVHLTNNNVPAVHFTTNNIPAVRLVSLPAWEVYGSGYETFDTTNRGMSKLSVLNCLHTLEVYDVSETSSFETKLFMVLII